LSHESTRSRAYETGAMRLRFAVAFAVMAGLVGFYGFAQE